MPICLRPRAAALLVALLSCSAGAATAGNLQLLTVHAASRGAASSSLDGVVEPVRETTLAAQVQGAIVALPVKVGDHVHAGQVLVRIDARAANQSTNASAAQVQAAKAAQDVAAKDLERQKQLFQKQYISQAALDRAQAQFLATQAQVHALSAQTGAMQTASGFYTLVAPYAAIISEVPVALGDMAMPGRTLVSLFDPSAMRISVAVPQSHLSGLKSLDGIRYTLPSLGRPGETLRPAQVQVLPAVDATSHAQTVRLVMATGQEAVPPGSFARVWLPSGQPASDTSPHYDLPASCVVQRAELSGVYVMGNDGHPSLRQVRVGNTRGNQVEILSGVQAGDRVVLNPQLATSLP